ncbi:hypothetical protein T05_13021 [Trichinella murrelli]|uniref:Uncharacterized protein n=1 Tax=Trichinella murrelli TaxID=144512 RepID=A0A0V0SS55_9BILA|nr:hypothetical protein T05_13021 [Trichinella murrelli]
MRKVSKATVVVTEPENNNLTSRVAFRSCRELLV